MKTSPPPPVPLSSILSVLGLAVMGQAFLSQWQAAWTLGAGLALLALAGAQFRRWPLSAAADPRPLSWELPAFGLIFLLAAGARLWRLSALPFGLHQDMGAIGLCALRILREGWRPGLEAFQFQTPYPLEFYQIAGWFGLAGPSLFSLRLFFALLSLAAFPLLYLFLRRLAGPRTALLSLFFLAVMRWNWVETRNAHPSVEAPFYLLVLLVLFLYGVRDRKPYLLAAAALAAGLGFYAYQSLKALPLLLWALMAFERRRFPEDWKPLRRFSGFAAFLPLLLALPLFNYLWVHGTLGKRESETFILGPILAAQSLAPLFSSLSGMALMFNRRGPSDPFYNLPGHRLLDDGTGILFLLGLVLAWRLRKRREGAYPLIGFGVMALPGWLTSDAIPSQRYSGLEPFVAYFAALGGLALYDAMAGRMGKNKNALRWMAALALFAVAAQNTRAYFIQQAGDARCRAACGPEQTFIGREIIALEAKFPGRFRYFIDPFFYDNPTVRFMAYPARDRFSLFELEKECRGNRKGDKDAVVFLAGQKPGVLAFLRTRFPGGRTEDFANPDGSTGLYLFFVGGKAWEAAPAWGRGLKGVYSQGPAGAPAAVRVDPLLNFASRQDFPFTGPPPYSIRWSGRLEVPAPGPYVFQILTSDRARLWLDGKEIPLEKALLLAGGSHSLRLDYEKETGYYMALHWVWKKPGDDKWEVVPATALGSIQGKGRRF